MLPPYLTSTEVNDIKAILSSSSIFKSYETADGLIGQLPKFEYSDISERDYRIDISTLPYCDRLFQIPRFFIHTSPRLVDISKSQVVPLPAVSLETHKMKSESFPTTAAYKFLSFAKRLDFQLRNPQYVGCFGDGAGGFSKLTMLVTNAKVFYNSLIHSSVLYTNALGNCYPPCFAGAPHLRNRLLMTKFTFEGMSDLTDPIYASTFINNCDFKLEMIMCDAEGGGWESGEKALRMLFNLLQIAHHHQTEVLIFKTYYSNWYGFITQLNLMHDFFNTVSIIRSHFSSKYSSEVYLVGHVAKETIDKDLITQADLSNAHLMLHCELDSGFTIPLLNHLKTASAVSPLSSVSDKYTKEIQKAGNLNIDRVRLLLLSPKLDRMIDNDHLVYNFPYDYMRDVISNTHLVRFNKKFHKLTKTNFITRKFCSSIVIGWLTFLSILPDFSEQDLNTTIEEGVIIFYPVIRHHWSFWIIKHSEHPYSNTSWFHLKSLIRKSQIKEILSYSSKLKNLLASRINFFITTPLFPRLSLHPNNSRVPKYSWLCRPMQISSDYKVNKNLLGLNLNQISHGDWQQIYCLQNAELENFNQLKKSKFWTQTDPYESHFPSNSSHAIAP